MVHFLSVGDRIEVGTAVLQPRDCAAQVALDELEKAMTSQGQPLLLVVTGRDAQETADRLDRVESELANARAEHKIRGFSLPTGLWPHERRAQTNLLNAQTLYSNLNTMRAALVRTGFTSEAMAFTEQVFGYWNSYAATRQPIWPTNQSARWILRRAAADTPEGYVAAGAIVPNQSEALPRAIEQLHARDKLNIGFDVAHVFGGQTALF